MSSTRWVGPGVMRASVALAALCACACSASDGSGGGSGASAGSGSASGTGSVSGGGSGGGGAGSSGGTTAGGDIGDACASNADCTVVAGSECFTTIGGGPVPTITFPGGFCSKGCDANSEQNECGDNAGCASVGMSGGRISTNLSICTPPCAQNEDCRVADGYHCQLILPGFGFCAP